MRESSSSFRPDVEGLRGVAVLLVVGCHCGISWCAGGFVGVDVFFVLSGYLITGLLATEYRSTSRIDLPRFFARRARRLLPTSALVIVVVTFAAAAIFTPQEIEFSGRAALAAGLYVSNVFFDHTAADYFAPNVDRDPLLHTWSLGLEEQFYLAWPLLILFANRGSQRAQRSMWIFGGITALSFICSVYASQLAPTFAFYELPPRAWEFAVGGLLALLPVSRGSVSSSRAVACGIVGIATIIGTAVLVKGGAGFPGWIALFPVAGALATLFAGANAPRHGISAALSAAPLQFLGSRSYSWYLWHWPFIVFSGILFPGISLGGKIAAAIASLLVATSTFRLVERPTRESPYLSARSALSLGIAVGVTLLTIAASCILMKFGREQLTLDKRFQWIGAASADFGDISHQCFSEGRSFDVRVCEFGASSASQSLVIFGDSHAMQWVSPLRTAANLEGWRLITFLRPGCAASDINPHRLPAAADHCKEWRSRAIENIIARRPSAIVMASYNGAALRGDFFTATLMPTEEVRLGTRRTLEKLRRADVPIVVLRDTPLPPFNIPACIARHEVGTPHVDHSCDFDATAALNAEAFSAERAAADGLENIYFLDMNDLMCPRSVCYSVQNDIIVYRDEDHLTATFAGSMAPVLRARLFQLLRNAQSMRPSWATAARAGEREP